MIKKGEAQTNFARKEKKSQGKNQKSFIFMILRSHSYIPLCREQWEQSVTMQHLSKPLTEAFEYEGKMNLYLGSSGSMVLREETRLGNLLPWSLSCFYHKRTCWWCSFYSEWQWGPSTLLSSLLFHHKQNFSCPANADIYTFMMSSM